MDPRAILQDGIRKELVRQISSALHKGLVFDLRTGRKRNPVQAVHNALMAVHKRLAGFRQSFEYIQDYINTCVRTARAGGGAATAVVEGARASWLCTSRLLCVRRGALRLCAPRYGLKMWQEEFSRIIAFNVEQESNRYQRRAVLPVDSQYQSRAIPVPLFAPVSPLPRTRRVVAARHA